MTDRQICRALGMAVALAKYSEHSAADQIAIAEDIAATIEDFASEPVSLPVDPLRGEA